MAGGPMGRRGRWCVTAAVTVAAAAAVAVAVAAPAIASAVRRPGAAAAAAAAATAVGGAPPPPDASGADGLHPTSRAYVGTAWSAHDNVCHYYYGIAMRATRDCLPPAGHANHAHAQALGATIKGLLHVGHGARCACRFTAAEDADLHLAVLLVSPMIRPTCAHWSVRVGGGAADGGRGGAPPGAAPADAVDAATADAGNSTAKVGGSAPLREVPTRPASSSAPPARAPPVAPADAAPSAAPVGVTPASRLTIDLSALVCCDGFEEYGPDPMDSPCCAVGCRISAELFPFITQAECCDYLRDHSSGQRVWANRVMRNCV